MASAHLPPASVVAGCGRVAVALLCLSSNPRHLACASRLIAVASAFKSFFSFFPLLLYNNMDTDACDPSPLSPPDRPRSAPAASLLSRPKQFSWDPADAAHLGPSRITITRLYQRAPKAPYHHLQSHARPLLNAIPKSSGPQKKKRCVNLDAGPNPFHPQDSVSDVSDKEHDAPVVLQDLRSHLHRQKTQTHLSPFLLPGSPTTQPSCMPFLVVLLQASGLWPYTSGNLSRIAETRMSCATLLLPQTSLKF